MKKIVMIFAAMAAVLSSCQKSELESVSANESKDMVLNISVSNPGADDTKALIKTGWAANDEISIWYDGNVQATPDLVITYNGTKWIQKEGATVSGNTPSTGTGKYAKSLYNGTVKVASKDNYTFENNTLTFDIANWKFLTELQVVVKGLTSDKAIDYNLACDKFTPLAAGAGYTVRSDAITASTGTKGVAVTGISNTDGVAFVFATADYSSTAAAFKFTLIDNTATSAVTKEYTATTEKISGTTGSMTAIKALTIASTGFKAVATMDFVDLGLPSRLKWGVCNLGASDPWEYGKYFQWGDNTGHVCNGTSNGSTFEGGYNFQWSNTPFHSGTNPLADWTKYIPADKSSYWSGSGSVDKKTTLESTDDAAYNASNGAWRMPTKDDFEELCYYTEDTWVDNYNDTGISGRLFTSSVAGYTDKSVFFPAAGHGDGTTLGDAGSYGYYWSSSLFTYNPYIAYGLDFYSSNVNPQDYDYRSYGFPVRPVSN